MPQIYYPRLSAGSQAQSSALSFVNSNSISFGMSGSSQITASYDQTQITAGNNITLSQVGSTVTIQGPVFSNSNNVTFGVNAGTITASVNGAGVALGAGSQTVSTGSVNFINSNSITFGMSGSNQITASYDQTQITAGNNITLSQVGKTVTIQGPVFSNSNNVTFGVNGGTITASVAGGGAAAAAGSQTQTSGTLKFLNSNGISFGMSNSSELTASYAVSQITAGNSISLSQAGNTITIYGPMFSNSNGMAFGSNGGTITASYSVGTALSFSKLTTAPAAPAAGVGELYSIDDNGITFFEYQDSAGETIRVDRDLIISVQNNTGSTINKGQWVAFATNSSTGVTRIILARADSTTTTPCVGIMLDTVTTGNFGRCMISGVARGLNTSAFTDGDRIFLSPTVAGGVQVAIPATLGQFAQRVGIVIQANPSQGIILVSPTAAFPIVAQVGVAAGASTVTNSNVVFSNANNVTFGLAGSTITASVNGAGVAIGAGSQTVSTGSVNFVNSNNITFGMSGSSQITASYDQTQITAGNNITLSQVGKTVTIQGPVFSNSNNVSFGSNGSVITATASFPAQTAQPVAASASNGSYNFSTLKFVEGSGVTWATQANGIQASVKTDYQSSNANYLTSQSNQAVSGANGSFTFQTLTLANSNGVSFSTGTQGVYATVATNYQSQGAYLTTAALSGHSHGNPQLNLTNLTGTTASNSGGFTISLSGNAAGAAAAAGSQTQTSGTVQFVNSNDITFGMSNSSQITASYAVTQITGGSNITLAQAGSTVSINGPVFGNANGITFGTNSNTVTASFSITGGAGGAAIKASGTYSQNTGTVEFCNANGITFGLSNNGTLTASYAQTQITAGTNITLSQAGNTVTIQGPTFNNANNVTFGNNAGTITASASYPAQTAQPVAYAAGGTTNNFSTLGFVNSNGVTWSTGTGGVIATVATNYQSQGAYLTTAAQVSHSHGNPSLALTNISGTTASNSGGFTLSLSVNTGGAGGAAIQGSGTYSQNTGTVQFANSNNMTFGLSNNGAMTASYAVSQITAGANITLSQNGSTISIIGNPGGGGIAAGVSNVGNTAGNTGIFTTGTLVFAASNSATLSMSTGGGNVHTIWFLPLMMALSGGPGISLYTTNGTQIVIRTVTT